MKKLLSGVLTTAMLTATMAVPAMAEDEISVVLDGQKIEFDVQPQIINNRTMVPLRAIFEALDSTIEWNQDTQTVTSVKGDTKIVITINDTVMYVNDAPVALDSPACIVDNRTLVPVRAISEAYGTEVSWDENTRTVTIKSAVAVSDEYSESFDKMRDHIVQVGEADTEGNYSKTYPMGEGELYLTYKNDTPPFICMSYTLNADVVAYVLLNFDKTVGTTASVTFVYDEDNVTDLEGKYTSETKEFVKTNSTMTVEEEAIANDLLISVLDLMNAYMQSIDGVELSDFDVTYSLG